MIEQKIVGTGTPLFTSITKIHMPNMQIITTVQYIVYLSTFVIKYFIINIVKFINYYCYLLAHIHSSFVMI